MYRKNAWEHLSDGERAKVMEFAEKYKAYLDAGKTERECVTEAVRLAKEAGFSDLNAILREGKPLKAGDRVYQAWMGKCIMLFIIGEKDIECGMNIESYNDIRVGDIVEGY